MNDTFEWRGIARDDSKPLTERPAKHQKRCKQCGEIGHFAKTCGRPPASAPTRELRCGNCGGVGHNRMTCSNPSNPDHVPAQKRSHHSGKTSCTRCGGNDHNAARCQQTEITRPDRFCTGCGKMRIGSAEHGVTATGLCRDCFVRTRAVKPRPCKGCGREFTPVIGRRKVCSEECRRAVVSAATLGKFSSLVGVSVGWLTVVAHEKASRCVAKCRCGLEGEYDAHAVRTGAASSCRACRGIKRFEEMTDEQRASLAITRKAAHKQRHQRAQRAAMLGLGTDATTDQIARSWHLHQRSERKKVLNEFKRRPCMDCGQRHPPVCMDFDHRPGEGEVRDISKLVMGCAMDVLLEEIAKCDLICSNCHRMRTYKRLLLEQHREDDAGGLVP